MDGVGSRTLAELISWQALSKSYMETPEGQAGVDTIQQILRDSNEPRVMTQACQAMIDMDLREWVPKITSAALVVGGDEDLMTPWDQGPAGAGQQWIADHLPSGEVAVIEGSNHSTVFDGTEAHCHAVAEFFHRHPGAG
jgi:pimeloyl-ACP methyl ester carboxylesterase